MDEKLQPGQPAQEVIIPEDDTNVPAYEFDCVACGVHVYALGFIPVPNPIRCLHCDAIRSASDNFEQNQLRTFFYGEQEWNYWRSIGCYFDERSPPRDCDYCGKSYTGPAVYCSLKCALDDA